MRTASLLFALLVAVIVLFNLSRWLSGAHPQITGFMAASVAAYCLLSISLWRNNRAAAVIGVIVAGAGALLFAGAIYFMWPIISTELVSLNAIVEFAITMVGPVLLNVAIVGVLIAALRSNNRFERSRGASSMGQGGG
jgi:hypothetical protein